MFKYAFKGSKSVFTIQKVCLKEESFFSFVKNIESALKGLKKLKNNPNTLLAKG
jgi:hypothetical protein